MNPIERLILPVWCDASFFSQDQNRIERQQQHQAAIQHFLWQRVLKAFVNSVLRDPQNEQHVPGDGKRFEEGGKGNVFHFGYFMSWCVWANTLV